MIETLVKLFFEASKDWRVPKVVKVKGRDFENDPLMKKLKSEGHELGWTTETKFREKQRLGWRPVTERDKIGRPTVFTTPDGKLVLMHRPRPGASHGNSGPSFC